MCGPAFGAENVEPVKLQPKDRVVFLGDSITQQGAGPGGYVTLVREALSKNEATKTVEVIGAGISGNKVPDLENRLERDVLSKKPDVVVIYIGINDVWHWNNNRGTKKEDFESGLEHIISHIQEAGARVILCTPSVIGEKPDGSNDMDAMLEEYAAISRQVAKKANLQLLDLRKAFISHLKEHNKDNAAKGLLTGDGVHLNAAGNQFVAALMLAALGVEPIAQDKAAEKPGKVLRHVVLFKFKKELTKEEIKEVVDAFAALPKKINAIKDFEWGTDVSVENKAAGYTHGFIVSFASEKGRDDYLPHPAHKEFGKLVGPRLEGVLVFDFWAGK
jgi:lysophospholipase L1-like esterase